MICDVLGFVFVIVVVYRLFVGGCRRECLCVSVVYEMVCVWHVGCLRMLFCSIICVCLLRFFPDVCVVVFMCEWCCL